MTLFERAEALRKKLNQQLEEKGAFGTAAIIADLQEQDRITRHACAEAVVTLAKRTLRDGDREDYFVWLDDAHTACINVKTE